MTKQRETMSNTQGIYVTATDPCAQIMKTFNKSARLRPFQRAHNPEALSLARASLASKPAHNVMYTLDRKPYAGNLAHLRVDFFWRWAFARASSARAPVFAVSGLRCRVEERIASAATACACTERS